MVAGNPLDETTFIGPMIDEKEAARLDGWIGEQVARTPDAVAYDFFGTTAPYRELGEEVDRFADALASLGLGAGERMTISMPT